MKKKTITSFIVILILSLNSICFSQQLINGTENISVDFIDADIKDVLSVLTTTTKYSIAFSEDIQGKVSIRFNNVPVMSAIEAVIAVSGFTYTISDKIIRVTTIERLENAKKSQKLLKQKTELIPLVFSLKYINAKNIENIVKTQLSPQGTVEFLKSSKEFEESLTMVITDSPKVLEKIKIIIDQLDMPPAQILLGTRVVELTTAKRKKIDTQWEVLAQLFTREKSKDNAIVVRSKIVPSDKLEEIIKNLGIKGEVNILLNSSLRTLNNYDTSIMIGESLPHNPIAINLLITPQVLKDSSIKLNLKPSLSKIEQSPKAKITEMKVQRIKTQTILKSGETIVLSGLTETKKIRTAKIPGLAKIPLLGLLFRGRQTSQKKEILVFITPHLLKQ